MITHSITSYMMLLIVDWWTPQFLHRYSTGDRSKRLNFSLSTSYCHHNVATGTEKAKQLQLFLFDLVYPVPPIFSPVSTGSLLAPLHPYERLTAVVGPCSHVWHRMLSKRPALPCISEETNKWTRQGLMYNSSSYARCGRIKFFISLLNCDC